MLKSEKELIFDQLITKIRVGSISTFEKLERIVILSKGIIIAHNNEIVFYDFKRYSKTFIMYIKRSDRDHIKLSKLLYDKFCVYTQKETLIYQLNAETLEIELINRININLNKLIELEKDQYVNITEKYVYIWKNLQSIYKFKRIIPLIFNLFLNYFLIKYYLYNLRKIFAFFIISIINTIIIKITRKYTYLLNSYKRIKIDYVINIEKCGANQCLIKSYNFLGIFNYKKNKIKKIIIPPAESPYFWNYFIINENIIIFTQFIGEEYKIYNIHKDKIFIHNNKKNFNIDYKNTFKIGQNLYITFNHGEIIKWKYYFALNDIKVIYRKEIKLKKDSLISHYINDNKLFILKKEKSTLFGKNNFYLYIYK